MPLGVACGAASMRRPSYPEGRPLCVPTGGVVSLLIPAAGAGAGAAAVLNGAASGLGLPRLAKSEKLVGAAAAPGFSVPACGMLAPQPIAETR